MGALIRRNRAKRKARQAVKEQNAVMIATAQERAKGQRKMAKLSKRNAKKLGKIYGDLNPEEINEMNKIQPYVGAMVQELQDAGIEVNNQDDPIEVAGTYNSEILGAEQPEEVNAENFESLYSESLEDVERGKIGTALKAVTAGIGAAFGKFAADAREKKAAGKELSPAERSALKVEAEAKEVKNDIKKDEVKKTLYSFIPILLLGIVAWLIFK